MQRRIACISLPEIRIELAQEAPARQGQARPEVTKRGRSSSPLAVIVARPGGSVKSERDVLGNTRIDFVSREAGNLGVRSGQTVAAARAKCAELRVRVLAEAAVFSALARIAEAALAFGPTTSFDVAQDVVWVDVGGCAHLHRSEIELSRALQASVEALGHCCRVAVADGPRLAAAVARFSSESEPVVVPRDKGAAAMRPLPLGALGLDEPARIWLAELGLSICGDLQKLPRRALGARLGTRASQVLALLDGLDHTPLDAWRPPEVPEERVEFDWGVHSVEALTFMTKKLCDRLSARLVGRALAAARLELVLTLDRALCNDPSPNSHRTALSMLLPSPIVRGEDILAVVRTRLENCSLAAPVLAMTLRAPELARAPSRALDLLEPEPKADRVLPRLAAELTAEIGEEAVGTLSLADTWVPDGRTRLLPLGASAGKTRYSLVTSALEPSRLVSPKPISCDALADAQHLVRVEAVEWWRESRSSSTSGNRRRRDLFSVWAEDALCWVELRGPSDNPLLRGWID